MLHAVRRSTALRGFGSSGIPLLCWIRKRCWQQSSDEEFRSCRSSGVAEGEFARETPKEKAKDARETRENTRKKETENLRGISKNDVSVFRLEGSCLQLLRCCNDRSSPINFFLFPF